MKQLLKVIILICIIQSGYAQGNFIKDSLDVYIKREMARWNLPGMAIAVVKDGKVVFMKGYGYANMSSKTPVDENTVFQIASCSKAFTGTSLALLEHYGKLKLSDKVKTYLPYFKMSEAWRTEEITITDVLSHRIGFSTFQSDFLNWNCNRPRKDLIANMVNIIPKYSLREHYGYCNLGFLTAGEIIPAVTDTTWDDYLKFHYFTPLDMKNTSTLYKEFMASPNASHAYTNVDGKITELVPANVDKLGPAGSVSSSVNDMSKWIMMQLANGKYNGKQVVPAKVIQKTRMSNTIVGDGPGKGNNFETYGLGWFLKDEGGKKVVEHDGGANGFLSKTVLIPEENTGFVILTNSDAQYLFEALGKVLVRDITKQSYFDYSPLYYSGFSENQTQSMNEIAGWRKAAASFKAKKEDYKKLEGTYSNKVYGKITVVAKDQSAEVSFEFHPQYKAKMQYTSATTLLIEYNDPALGVKEIKVDDANKTIELRVNDFVDMDPYLFTKN
ncbi:MAG: beta-lactamase family protein [Bacteroidetes bacterium]|nr:beta-lactamase family protein [Bacteroidota bacterium]